jgi:hypothetical protein
MKERKKDEKTHLNLPNAQIQKRHPLPNLNNTLRTNTTHRRSQSTVELENSELVEQLGVLSLGQLGVRDDLFLRGGLDLFPVAARGRGSRMVGRRREKDGSEWEVSMAL